MRIISLLHVIVVVQSLLFSLVLFSRIKDRPGNPYLAALLMTIAANFSYNFFFSNELASRMLISFSPSYGFLYGPLGFLYIRASLWSGFRFRPVTALHFLPFLAIIIAVLSGVSFPSKIGVLVLVSMSIYLVVSYLLVRQYEGATKHVLSQSTSSQLRWHKGFLLFMLIIVISNFLSQSFLPVIEIGSASVQTEVFVQLGILILVNIVVVQGLRNPGFFIQLSQEDLALQKVDEQKQNTGYSQNLVNEVAVKVRAAMEQQAYYLQSDLTVNRLSELIDVHPKLLSQAINEQLGDNFSEYINSMRIEFAKDRLQHPRDKGETIVEVMYDAGFNSRSVFNTLFKEKTGKTPSEFKRNPA